MSGKPMTAVAYCAAVLLAASACTPDEFLLNRYTDSPFGGRIMTDLNSVEYFDKDEHVVIYGNGKVALNTFYITQHVIEFYTTVRRGAGANFYVRTVPKRFDLSPAVSLRYDTNGCRLEENGKLLTEIDSVYAIPQQQERIQFINDGAYLSVVVGCSVVWTGRVSLPCTHYLVVEGLPNSKVELSRFSYSETIPFNLYDTQFLESVKPVEKRIIE